MILRSQLRMNKNIVFPFISCVLIMFTLLVLLHKSTDELMTVKKELNHCREQYESTFTQLQSAIDLKLRLEKSLEDEKSNGRQKVDNIQAQLEQERKDRQTDLNEANSKYDSLNTKFSSLQTENADLKDQRDKLNNELNSVDTKLKEAEKVNEMKNQIIHNLQEQLKIVNASTLAQKLTSSIIAGPQVNDSLKGVSIQNVIKESPTTPNINPAAVNHQMDESFKQVLPPPDAEKENPVQKELLESLNMGIVEQIKPPQENVGKPPLIRSDGNVVIHDNLNGENNGEAPRNELTMNLQKPPNFDPPNKPVSSVSNNAAENPEVIPPQPMANEKKTMHKMKDYPNAEYDNNLMAEDEGEMEYPENGNKKDTN